MPTYEYKREDGTIFEIQQSIKEDALKVCPTTGQKVKRVISGGGGVVYKGDGWYVTDYKNGGKKREKEAGEKPDSPKKTESASDPKPSGSSGEKKAGADSKPD